MDRTSLEFFLRRGMSLAAIGRRLGRHEATVAYWVHKHGLEAVNRDRHLARGGIRREDLERLVEAGASIAEIAATVERSKATGAALADAVRTQDAWHTREASLGAGSRCEEGWSCLREDVVWTSRRNGVLA
jgi:transposase